MCPADFSDEDEEEIPGSLQEKWRRDEEKGRRAGTCLECGNLFSDEDLFCRHCGARTSMPGGVLGRAADIFLRSFWGFLVTAIFLGALFAFLIF